MPLWNLLHRFKDNVGEVASGAQIDENFDQQREKIEAQEVAGAALAARITGLEGTGNAWSVAGAALNKAETPSGAGPSLITITLEPTGGAVAGSVKIGGQVVARYNTSTAVFTMGEFLVGKGETWELAHAAGALTSASVATRIL